MKTFSRIELVFFCLQPYLFLGALVLIGSSADETTNSFPAWMWPLLLGIVFAMLIGEIHFRIAAKRVAQVPVSRYLAKAAFTVKLSHVPFYVFIFLICVFSGFLIPAPVIGVMIAGSIWILAFIIDWVLLLLSDILLWGAIKACQKDRVITLGSRFASGFFAIFFLVDFFIALHMNSKTRKLWKAAQQGVGMNVFSE